MEIKRSSGVTVSPTGMRRSSLDGRTDFTLVRDGPLYKRWAVHLSKGAGYYGPRNWLLSNTLEDMMRFRESASRHFDQWLEGEVDEDHPAAVCFNMNGYEYVKAYLQGGPPVHESRQAQGYPHEDFS